MSKLTTTCGRCGFTPMKRYYIIGKSKFVCRTCYEIYKADTEGPTLIQRTGDETV